MVKVCRRTVGLNVVVKVGLYCNHSVKNPHDGPLIGAHRFQVFCRVLSTRIRVAIVIADNYACIPCLIAQQADEALQSAPCASIPPQPKTLPPPLPSATQSRDPQLRQ